MSCRLCIIYRLVPANYAYFTALSWYSFIVYFPQVLWKKQVEFWDTMFPLNYFVTGLPINTSVFFHNFLESSLVKSPFIVFKFFVNFWKFKCQKPLNSSSNVHKEPLILLLRRGLFNLNVNSSIESNFTVIPNMKV